MTADEIALARQRYRARLEELLDPAQLALLDGFHRRIEAQVAAGDPAPTPMSAEERAVLDLIADDAQASGLRAQLDILTRVERPPQ